MPLIGLSPDLLLTDGVAPGGGGGGPDITTDLVRWYKLNEGTGSTANDSSGNASHGTINGNPAWVGDALDFDASGDYISFTAPDLTDKSFSIAIRFNYDNGAGDRMLLAIGNNFTNHEALHLRAKSDGAILFGEYFNDLNTDDGLVVPGTWQHVTFVYNYVTGYRGIYLDGVEVESEPSGVPAFEGNTAGNIGRWFGNGEDWAGLLKDVRIWSGRALSAEEVEAVFEDTDY